MCGQLGVMLLARFFFQWILVFCSIEQGTTVLFSAAVVGLIVFGFRIFDGITDPVAGAVSDIWVRRGNKRKVLILIALPLAPLGLICCFAPGFELASSSNWLLLVGGMLLFFLGYTFYAIPYWALISDYARDDLNERTVLSNLLGVGLLGATAIGFTLTPALVSNISFFESSILIAVAGAILMLLPYFAEPDEEILEKEIVAVDQVGITPWSAAIEALKHKKFMAVTAIFIGSQMSLTVMTAAAPFIAVGILGGTKADVALLMGPMLLAAAPSFLLSGYLSRRFGWQNSIVGAAILLMFVYVTTAFLGTPLLGTPMTTAMFVFALAGPMIAILLGLEGEAVAACADESKSRSVSTYFGVINLLVKTFNGVALFVTGVLVDMSEGAWGTTAIRSMVFFAGGCLLIGVICFYRLRPKPS